MSNTQLKISLEGKIITGKIVKVNYNALPGTDPKFLGYFLAIWQGSQIQGLDKALDQQNITTTSQDGSLNFDNLALGEREYIIGLGVNLKDGHSICATVNLPGDAEQGKTYPGSLSEVSILDKGTDSLIAGFKTPAYNVPNTNDNWIALFEGPFTANMYSGTNVKYTTKITDANNNGAQSMNDIPGGGLIRFQQYTLVYGMGFNENNKPNFSNLVSAVEFQG